jgi:hypothetical protein
VLGQGRGGRCRSEPDSRLEREGRRVRVGINPKGKRRRSEWRPLRVKLRARGAPEWRRTSPTRVWSEGGDTSSRRSRRLQERWPREEKEKNKKRRQRAKRTDVKTHLERRTSEGKGTLSISRLQRGRASRRGRSVSRLRRGSGGGAVSPHRHIVLRLWQGRGGGAASSHRLAFAARVRGCAPRLFLTIAIQFRPLKNIH